MFKRLVGLTVGAALVAGCGMPAPAGPAGPTSITTVPAEGSEGGFGSPAQQPGEFADLGTPRPVRGELQLADNGCWSIVLGGSSHLLVFPDGFAIPESDPTTIAAPDGTVYGSGTLVDGTAFELVGDQVPGGDAGRWGNYVDFCDPVERSLAVFQTIDPAFDPQALSDEVIESLAAGALFTTSWPCGRGWSMSTEDQLVGLFIYQLADAELSLGTEITLPDDDWTARLVVGKHLFVNHCDDVFESWEPDPVIAAEWQVTGGTLEILDEPPAGSESGEVRAILSGATVTTDTGALISFERIELINTGFNFFAG